MAEFKDETIGKAVGTAVVIVGGAVYAWWRRRKAARSMGKHPFFKRCLEVRSWARRLPIDDPMRREAIQDLLQIKLGVWHRDIESFVAVHDFDRLEGGELANMLHDFINATVLRYSDIARERGIPSKIVTKFTEWHAPAISTVHTFIDSICDSDWRSTPEMMTALLSWMLAALEQTIDHAEETLAAINGEIDGLEYKGLIARHYESPKRRRRRCSRSDDASKWDSSYCRGRVCHADCIPPLADPSQARSGHSAAARAGGPPQDQS